MIITYIFIILNYIGIQSESNVEQFDNAKVRVALSKGFEGDIMENYQKV